MQTKNLTKFTVKQGVTMWRMNTQDRSHKAKQNISYQEAGPKLEKISSIHDHTICLI